MNHKNSKITLRLSKRSAITKYPRKRWHRRSCFQAAFFLAPFFRLFPVFPLPLGLAGWSTASSSGTRYNCRSRSNSAFIASCFFPVFQFPVDRIQLVRILLQVKQLPLPQLVVMDQLLFSVGHSVVPGHAVTSRKLVVVIVKGLPPVRRGPPLEQWNEALSLHICGKPRPPAASRKVSGKSRLETISPLIDPGSITPPGQLTNSGVLRDSSYIQRLSNQPCSPRYQPWSLEYITRVLSASPSASR